MEFQELLFRFLVGGTIVTFISLLGETKYNTLSGLFVLFPAVTATGYYFVSKTMTTPELQDMAIFIIISLPILGAFIVGFYVFIEYYTTTISIMLSIGLWCITALILIFLNDNYLNLT